MDLNTKTKLTPALLITLSLTLAGCQTKAPTAFLNTYQIAQPTEHRQEFCNAPGCDDSAFVSLNEEEWQAVESIFSPLPESPADERKRIATTIALFEKIIGPKTGTQYDAPRNGGGFSNRFNLDCIAESANTTVALMMLEQRGLLRHHKILYPSHRGPLSFQLPHNAAAIIDLQTDQRYVVDSWFHANGIEPEIVPQELWADGYSPDSKTE